MPCMKPPKNPSVSQRLGELSKGQIQALGFWVASSSREKTSCVIPRTGSQIASSHHQPPHPHKFFFFFPLCIFLAFPKRVFSCVAFLEEGCLMSSKSLLIPQVFVLIHLTPNSPGCTSQRTPWATSTPSTSRVVSKTQSMNKKKKM